MLALNEAERVGVEVNPITWRLAQEYWQQTQKEDGSWGYKPGLPATGSMTCAGICSLVIASGRLSSGSATIAGGKVSCCGEGDENNGVERGLFWLGKNFSVRANPGDRSWLLYYLYGLERVGRLTGRRLIGGHDWYREGAEVLLREQDDFSGSWQGVETAESNSLVATSLALLFLSKGRRPVVIAKAKYEDGREWDLHAGGVPNLTRHIEKAWLRELTWQTIDLQAATVGDLLEAPVLFISGRQPLTLTRDQRENLRMYVEQGGFIFAEACDGDGCDGKAFDASFRQLMKDLFPASGIRLLPADHAVWFAEGKSGSGVHALELYGVDACCRTSVVYCPTNLSCYWELSAEGRELDVPEAVKKDDRGACADRPERGGLCHESRAQGETRPPQRRVGGQRGDGRITRRAGDTQIAARGRQRRRAQFARQPDAVHPPGSGTARAGRTPRDPCYRRQSLRISHPVCAWTTQLSLECRGAQGAGRLRRQRRVLCSPMRSVPARTSRLPSAARWRRSFPSQKLERIPSQPSAVLQRVRWV